MFSSTHFLHIDHDISLIYCTKVHEIFTTRKFLQTYIPQRVSRYGYIGFAIFPAVVKMAAQTIKALNANLSPSRATKFVAMVMSLYRSSPNFSCRIFFIDGVKETILVDIRPPVVE